MAKVREIQLGDEVRNTNGNDISGIVIAKYQTATTPPETRLDVRSDEHIYYDTPMKYWATIVTVEDRE